MAENLPKNLVVIVVAGVAMAFLGREILRRVAVPTLVKRS